MKTMRPNLSINLQSRKNLDLNIPGGLSTPVEQTCSTPLYPPGHNYAGGFQTPVLTRNNSVSSLYYEEDSRMNVDTPNTSVNNLQKVASASSMASSSMTDFDSVQCCNVNFSANFDETLISSYHSYATRPDTTPFNPKFPPSGAASSVAKDVLQLVSDGEISIEENPKLNEELLMQNSAQFLLGLIRRRLYELCGKRTDGPGDYALSRQSSVSSIGGGITAPFVLSRQNSTQSSYRPTWLNQNQNFQPNRFPSSDSLTDSVPQVLNIPPNPPSYGLESDEFSFENKSRKVKPSHITLPQNINRQPLNPHLQQFQVYNPPPQNYPLRLQSPISCFDSSSTQDAGPLQSPFSERPSPLSAAPTKPSNNSSAAKCLRSFDLDVDSLYNSTSQRKRDSLKLKRNMK